MSASEDVDALVPTAFVAEGGPCRCSEATQPAQQSTRQCLSPGHHRLFVSYTLAAQVTLHLCRYSGAGVSQLSTARWSVSWLP